MYMKGTIHRMLSSKEKTARGEDPGGLLSPKWYVDVSAGPRKFDFLYTNFLLISLPISVPFSKEKHPILTKLDTFTIICLKYTQFM